MSEGEDEKRTMVMSLEVVVGPYKVEGSGLMAFKASIPSISKYCEFTGQTADEAVASVCSELFARDLGPTGWQVPIEKRPKFVELRPLPEILCEILSEIYGPKKSEEPK